MPQTFDRDPGTGMLVSTDDSQYRQILAARERNRETRTIMQRLDSIDAQLVEIKQTLQLLVNGNK